MKLLIIHGPNMNLLGSFSTNRNTLDKLNRKIRQTAREQKVDVKIYQTHNQAKYVTLLQRNRNKVDGMILNLGPWHVDGLLIKDTLSIINPKYRIVEDINHSKEYLNQSLFDKGIIIGNSDINQAYCQAMEQLVHT